MAKNESSSLLKALRLIVAAALIGVLLYGVDWRAIPRVASNIDWRWLALAVLALSSHFLISPWKWQWALRIHGLQFELAYLVRANGIGFFFNNFLPSAIGGDAYRIMSTWPGDGYRSRAVSAVLVERLVGLLALGLWGLIGAGLLFNEVRLARVFLGASLGAAILGLVLLATLILSSPRWLSVRTRTSGVLQAVVHNIDLLRCARMKWIPLTAISLLFQAVAVLYTYALLRSLGAPTSLAACALIATLSGLAAILPISINGIGVVEGAFAGAAVALGVDYEIALVAAVLVRLIVLPLSLIFGAVYALSGDGLLATHRSPQAPP